MGQHIDIYSGWIVAFVDGQWRHVHISPGWVTVADWLHPNEHIGVFREDDVRNAKAGEAINYEPIGRSPFALVAGPVLDPDVFDRIAIVRFGRVPTGEERYAIVDDFNNPSRGIDRAMDLDDSNGLDPGWSRYDPRGTPSGWDRTARSLVIS